MKTNKSVWCLAVAVAIPILTWAAGPEKAPKNEPPAKEVELFAGMKSGEIEAVLIYKDATQGSINIKNKTGQPLAIKLPEAFAGVPILAQRGGGGGGNAGGLLGGGGGGGGSAGAQGMGARHTIQATDERRDHRVERSGSDSIAARRGKAGEI